MKVLTAEDLQTQEQLINDLQKELEKLNLDFDALMREAKLTPKDLEDINTSALPPELAQKFEEAKREAVLAGKARAAQADGSGSGTVPGAGRKDAVRI